MISFFDLIETGDACSVGFLIFIVCIVGSVMVPTDSRVYEWGKRIAGAAFVLYVLYSWVNYQPSTSEEWIGVVFRGAMAAGLALGTSWIILSVIGFVYRHTVGKPFSFVRSRISAMRRKAQYDKDHEKRLTEDQHRKEGEQRLEQERDRLEKERREWEQQQRESDLERELELKKKFALTECALLYNGHAGELAQLFPRKAFDSFIEKHFTSAQSVQEIDEFSALLKSTIKRYLDIIQYRPSSFQNISEVAAHFQNARNEIEKLSYDTETKETLLAYLAMAEEQAIERFLAQ